MRRYEQRVFTLLGRMLLPHDRSGSVEDLAQETFLRVFRALARFERDGPAKLSTWILCIASRVAINELGRKRPAIATSEVEALAGTFDDPRRTLAESTLHRAIATLTPEQRAVLVLREFHGFDDAEIARALTIDEGAVRARLFRARRCLRRALGETDDDRRRKR